ncbi:MAG: FAD-binding oxidoreductase [Enterobacterales bacterium]|nr:FAD-binding oxidoreductase [Enterobacterales bacterium]
MNKFETNDATCGWIKSLSPRLAKPAFKGHRRTKWLIIGAGYSGLSAALTLAENNPNDHILLVDANKAGEGASSRNSGYLVDSTLNDGHLSDTGLMAYRKKYELNQQAVLCVKSLIEKYNISCEWNECGKFYATANPEYKDKLIKFHKLLDDLKIENSLVEQQALSERLGTGFYQLAVKTQGGAMIQPAKLARGMLEILPDNVELYENSAVLSIVKGQPHKVQFSDGEILADKVIVAVNGFMPSMGIKKNRVFPLLLSASLTRPLSIEEQQKMNHAQEWAVLSANAMGATIRTTHDKRIMIRNTVEVVSKLYFTAAELAQRQKTHLKGLRKRFKFLPDDIFESTWSGVTCISANNANIFEEIDQNLWAIGCYNGGGIGLSVMFGQQIAHLAMDQPASLTKKITQRPQAKWLPPQPFLSLGIKAKLAKDKLGATLDN